MGTFILASWGRESNWFMARHHYVPQFYLRYFALSDTEDKIYAYRRQREPFLTEVNAVAATNDFNSYTDSKGNKNDVIEIFTDFQKLLNNKPSMMQMYDEIRMMKFKIRPMQGDILNVNLQNPDFIETLWSLGKLDEIFQKEYRRLSSKNKQVFFRIFDNLYQRLQSGLNKIRLQPEKMSNFSSVVEMEIFKEQKHKKSN